MNLIKANLLLLGAAAILAVPTWITVTGERELYVDVAAVPRMFEGFTADSVAQLVLGTPKAAPTTPPPANPANDGKPPPVEHDTIAIARTEKGFVLQQVPQVQELTGAPVNKDLLDSQIWKHLADIRLDRQTLVQADATDAQLAEYGLDLPQAFVIQAKNAAGAVIADLLIGKDAGGKGSQSAVRGTFLRKADSRDVVLYEPSQQAGMLARTIKPEMWLDRTVLKAPPDKIRKLAVRNLASNGQRIEFSKPEGKDRWIATNPPAGCGAVRQQEIETLSQRFAFVVAQDIKRQLSTANVKALGLEPAQMELVVTYVDGQEEKTVELAIGNKVDGKNEYYLRSSNSMFLLTWAAHYVSAFEKDPKDWFDPDAIAPGGDAKPATVPGKQDPVAPGKQLEPAKLPEAGKQPPQQPAPAKQPEPAKAPATGGAPATDAAKAAAPSNPAPGTVEAPKADAPKVEAPKPDPAQAKPAPKPEAPKPESPKPASGGGVPAPASGGK
jgi:hypothetical protein